MVSQRKILVVEDDLTLGEILAEGFERCGYSASWFVRARIADGKVILMNPDGKESTLDAASYDVAFVDYRLKGSPLDGTDLTPYLVAAGLPVVAMSGLDTFNQQMIGLGARASFVKEDLAFKLLRQQFDVEPYVRF